jgi:hypothetical protein
MDFSQFFLIKNLFNSKNTGTVGACSEERGFFCSVTGFFSVLHHGSRQAPFLLHQTTGLRRQQSVVVVKKCL